MGKYIFCVALISCSANAAEVTVFKNLETVTLHGCTTTRDHFIASLGEYDASCVSAETKRAKKSSVYLKPNSILWNVYISNVTLVLIDESDCTVVQSFRNAYNVEFKEIDCRK